MNILFVVEYYYPHVGGMETLFKNLCEGLAKHNHKVSVVTSQLFGTEKQEQLNGVRIFRVVTPDKNGRYWFTLLAIPTVLKLAREADIIHTTTYNGAFSAWLASKIYRKPCVITVLEILGELWQEFQGMNKFVAKSHRFLEWVIIKLGFDRYVGISDYTSKRIQEYGKQAVTVYLGIDYQIFKPDYYGREDIRKLYGFDGKFIYMFYGRPGLSKGVEYLINAVRLVRDKIPNSLCYLILGDEPADRRKMIYDMIDLLDIKDSVILSASVPYNVLPHQIAASDCVVIPSLSEGFGFSAAEACAMGKPVVASNVASLPEVVSGKFVLVEPRNPKAIARGIIQVYEGKFHESKSKKFTWDDCIDGYEKIYVTELMVKEARV
jgi:glycosyltransferase involved in cell wall biosynthesis